ncbi:MAG: class I SAM-dependent methyltransferase [Phycisphaerae bacterium]|nr:class I SAM-dependent methyltransferase [Phycisphaerae bacterium]
MNVAPRHSDRHAQFHEFVVKAANRRRALRDSLRGDVSVPRRAAYRVFGGKPDGIDGVYIDVYDNAAVLIVYEGIAPDRIDWRGAGAAAVLSALGVRAVYFKPFARDRSRMGGEMPPEVLDPMPAAGEPVPAHVLIDEYEWTLEVQLHGGLSTGLFLDQRENRRFVWRWVKDRGGTPAVLNTFSYTCAFSVAAAAAGAVTASIDVSAKYLEWGRRNFIHNGIDAAPHRFARMDTFEFFAYAQRKGLGFDFVILDPPSFAAGSRKKGTPPFSAVSDYARLIAGAAALLRPRGVILASTNTRELCLPGRLERVIAKGLGQEPKYLRQPPPAEDFAAERGRFAARIFSV